MKKMAVATESLICRLVVLLYSLCLTVLGQERDNSTTSSSFTGFKVTTAIEFITGGISATEGEFPWQVSLQKGPGRHFCGGSIVNSTFIITASHCTVGQNPSSLIVVAGAHNMKDASETGQQRIRVKRLAIHPRYNSWNINNDISVLVLESPLEFSERVQPIKLPPAGHEPYGKCVTSGWGNANRLGLRPVIIPDKLQRLNMTIVTRGLCRIPYLFFARSWLTSGMICGGAGTLRGSCNGDSGGPLVCFDHPEKNGEPYLAGVTSFGVRPCGQMLFPTVFANVAHLREFIDKEIDSEEVK